MATLLLAAAGRAELVVTDAWLREPPPVAVPVAGYLVIENTGPDPITVRSIESPRFARIEWHTVQMVDGVARMRPVAAPVLAAGASIALAPGGDHLMLFEPDGALAAGDRVPLRITASDGSEAQALAIVRAAVDRPAEPHRHHHHH